MVNRVIGVVMMVVAMVVLDGSGVWSDLFGCDDVKVGGLKVFVFSIMCILDK